MMAVWNAFALALLASYPAVATLLPYETAVTVRTPPVPTHRLARKVGTVASQGAFPRHTYYHPAGRTSRSNFKSRPIPSVAPRPAKSTISPVATRAGFNDNSNSKSVSEGQQESQAGGFNVFGAKPWAGFLEKLVPGGGGSVGGAEVQVKTEPLPADKPESPAKPKEGLWAKIVKDMAKEPVMGQDDQVVTWNEVSIAQYNAKAELAGRLAQVERENEKMRQQLSRQEIENIAVKGEGAYDDKAKVALSERLAAVERENEKMRQKLNQQK